MACPVDSQLRDGSSPPAVRDRQSPDVLETSPDPNLETAACVAADSRGAWAKATAVEKWLARRLLRRLGDPAMRIVLWDGQAVSPPQTSPQVGILIRDRPTFWKLLVDPDLHFGDAYGGGRIEVEGDLLELLKILYRSVDVCGKPNLRLGEAALGWIPSLPSRAIARSRENVHHHYDLGNDFYRLWLDDDMVYSGAYFPAPAATLQRAQRAKLEYVCRKLWLKPGETVVDVGSGWVRTALYMAEHYGVRVQGFNISREQIAYARRRAETAGLADRVEFIEDDYRNLRGRFDALVSLGMLEHVGADHYREFGAVIDRCLTPTGRGLIQSIARCRASTTNAWVQRRIFPGGYLPTLREMMDLFEPAGFSVLDVEDLHLHYAKTLEHWLARFESVTAAGGPDVRPAVRADLAALPGRVAGRIRDRIAQAAASRIRAARSRRHPVYAGPPLCRPADRERLGRGSFAGSFAPGADGCGSACCTTPSSNTSNPAARYIGKAAGWSNSHVCTQSLPGAWDHALSMAQSRRYGPSPLPRNRETMPK